MYMKNKFIKKEQLKISLLIVFFFNTFWGVAQVVETEHIRTGWQFSKIVCPSKSDAASHSTITLAGNKALPSCLSLKGLHNGVLAQECRLVRDFFCFTNQNPKGGRIVMDLGNIIPVKMINSYSAQGPVGGTTWCEEFKGEGGPQVYTVYGSSLNSPNPNNLTTSEWIKIAEVDTRPLPDEDWIGQYGVNIKAKNNGVLGNFRWIVWDVKPTCKPNINPEWTNTWYAELDVHTDTSLAHAGDAIPAGSQLEEMIVVYKTHFDIGFTHPAPEIVDIYRTSMIDKALDIIDESYKMPAEKRFSWTIPSWVASQMLWEGQEPDRKKRIIDAIKNGSIVVHGLPVTLHTESLSLQDLVFGLSFNKKLSREIGIPLSRSGKLTDVPSHSWIWPTIFKNAGMDFLQIGVNPTKERPDLPLLYYWEGPDSSRLLTMHSQGYGSDTEFGHGLYPPVDWPYKHWLAMLVTSDNAGPPQIKDIQNVLDEAARNLPGVRVRFGKMDDFADAIFKEEKNGATIPVIRADMPDRWIHGLATMPVAESIAHKVREEIVSMEILNSHTQEWGMSNLDIRNELFHAHEQSLMYGEHTFGGAKNLSGKNVYALENFEDYIKKDERCIWLTKTWDDHFNYIREAAKITDSLVTNAMEELALAVSTKGKHIVVYNPLPYKRDAIVEVPNSGGKQIVAKNIPPCGYKTYKLDESKFNVESSSDLENKIIENKFLKIEVDRKRGGIISVINKEDGRELIDSSADYAFGQYYYQRFDSVQNYNYHIAMSHLNSVYGSNGSGDWGWNTRADLPSSPAYQHAVPEYEKMNFRETPVGMEVTLQASPQGIIRSRVTVAITLPNDFPWFEIEVRLDDKKPDYWPEAGSVYLPVKAETPQYRVGRLGAMVDPFKDFVSGSNRTFGYVNTGTLIADKTGVGVGICPLDHGIVSFGDKGLCMIDDNYVPDKPTALINMYNNIWTINFPYWIQGSLSSKVRVWATDNLQPESLIIPATEALSPVLTGYADNGSGLLQDIGIGMQFSRLGVKVISFTRDSEGQDILRLWETIGKSENLTITMPENSKFVEAIPIDLRGMTVGNPIPIVAGKLTFNLKAYSPAGFVLK